MLALFQLGVFMLTAPVYSGSNPDPVEIFSLKFAILGISWGQQVPMY